MKNNESNGMKMFCDRCHKDISNLPYIKRRSALTDFFCVECEPYLDEFMAKSYEEFDKIMSEDK